MRRGGNTKPITWIENWDSALKNNLSSPCHECTSHFIAKSGYAKQGKQNMHRHVYENRFGILPKNIDVRHKCDNRKCINLDHLVSGTRAENMSDCTTRQRTHQGYKLKESDVVFILTSPLSNKEIAEKYGISSGYTSEIRTRKRWRRVNLPYYYNSRFPMSS